MTSSTPLPRLAAASSVIGIAAACAQLGQEKPREQAGVVEYAPGLRIDWGRRRVELDGKVCLREGMLELFACSSRTREHESIVVVHAQPQRVFEAIGLLGAEPGHPVRFDEDSKQWLDPTGDSLRITVQWRHDGRPKTADIGEWMRIADTDKSLPADKWVFAGSTRTPQGDISADQEGTVIAVVDFPSAIIAWPERKSADNEQLWLRANPDAIPPIGTPVTILISPIDKDAKPVPHTDNAVAPQSPIDPKQAGRHSDAP